MGYKLKLLNLIELLELDDINLTSYASPLKIVTIGKILNFNSDTHVIDFGCGRGDALTLWGKYFNISGLGVEVHKSHCESAEQKIKNNNLQNKISIKCTDASQYKFEKNKYDIASCLGASMIWGGFKLTLQKLKQAIKDEGAIIIGEPYFTNNSVPRGLIELEGECHTESEILNIIRSEGFQLKFVKRASRDEKDRYRANFSGELQEKAIKYMKDYYYGWSIYVIKRQ